MKKRLLNNKKLRLRRFIDDISTHTPFTKMLFLLVFLWLLFSSGLYYFESLTEGASITSFGEALYWGVAAFSTAGIADTPKSSVAQLLGGVWIVIGSAMFFGTIVATITTYFMRPMQRPHKKIIETIEYNLEQMNDLTVEELDLLKETVDTLIVHVEQLKEKQSRNKVAK
ncbi:MAG: two pore domain potassium channel family protein [Gammaproteobacteria bacterium]|nr:two pore domain potassium channel family protein [Gammaproteobacteria bacterium]